MNDDPDVPVDIILSQEVKRINKFVDKNGYSIEYDSGGQLIIYTGIFAWEDGSFKYEEEYHNHDDL